MLLAELSVNTGEQSYHSCFGEGSDTFIVNSTIQHMAVDEGYLLPLTFTLKPPKSSLPM